MSRRGILFDDDNDAGFGTGGTYPDDYLHRGKGGLVGHLSGVGCCVKGLVTIRLDCPFTSCNKAAAPRHYPHDHPTELSEAHRQPV